MTERKPRKRQERKEKQTRSHYEQERRTLFSLVTFAAWTGEASGEHLAPADSDIHGYTSGMYGEDGRARALGDLAEGGYVIDLRPLADHPNIVTWVRKAPMPNGRIEGNEIHRLSSEARETAGFMAGVGGLQGEFQTLAAMAALRYGEPADGSAGMFDKVSAQYLAVYWAEKGALVGRRVGDAIQWSNGAAQNITPHPAAPRGGTQPRRGTPRG